MLFARQVQTVIERQKQQGSTEAAREERTIEQQHQKAVTQCRYAEKKPILKTKPTKPTKHNKACH